MEQLPDLERRRKASAETLARMRGTKVSWQGASCLHFAHAHMVAMGHELPPIPDFDSARSAMRAMRERGWDGVEDMLDAHLERIAPARMLLGDVATAPGEGGLATIVVSAGPFKLMSWHPETGSFALFDGGMAELTGAWRV